MSLVSKLSPHVIVISGASSGIGATLATEYAAPGRILYLCARRKDLLEQVAAQCQKRGASTHILACDVMNAQLMADWLEKIDRVHPVDILIANAGVSAGSGFGGETADQARMIFNTNVIGVANTILPLLPRMMTRGQGKIGIIASMAAFRGLPGAPAYSASKAAALAYADALRGFAWHSGVRVSAICPGYVRSPMTDKNSFPMPLLMDAEKAATIIIRGLERGKRRIAFPWIMYVLMRTLALMPTPLTDSLLRRLPAKKNATDETGP